MPREPKGRESGPEASGGTLCCMTCGSPWTRSPDARCAGWERLVTGRRSCRGYADRVEIVVDDLTGPQIASFLDEHVREMRSLTPVESKHALDLETLRGPGSPSGRSWTAAPWSGARRSSGWTRGMRR